MGQLKKKYDKNAKQRCRYPANEEKADDFKRHTIDLRHPVFETQLIGMFTTALKQHADNNINHVSF